MKNLNFLTNWWCSGKTKHVITTLKPRQSQVNVTWRFVAILTMLLTLGVGNVWGAATLTGNVVYSCSPTSIANTTTHQYWGSKSVARNNNTDLTASAYWEMNIGSNAGLGSNNNQRAKMILSNGSITGGSAIATAIGKNTSSTYVAAFVCNTALTNVGKFAFSHNGYNNNAPDNMWLCYSTDNWSTATAIALTVGNSGNVTFDATIPSAKYAFVIYKSSYTRVANPTFTFYEGATGGGCSNQVNITNSSPTNTTNGSFTLDKTGSQDACSALSVVVTPNPDPHYHVASVSATNPATTGTAGAAVDNGDGTYTITYSANAKGNSTISVTFAEDAQHTVTFQNNGITLASGGTRSVYHGEAIGALPSLTSGDACDGSSTTFMGWTASTITSKQAAAPTYITAGTIIDDDVTYNAVWAEASAGGGAATYTKVTTISAGTYLMASETAAQYTSIGTAAYTGDDGSGKRGGAVTVSISTGVISTKPATAKEITVTLGTGVDAGYFAMYDGSKYITQAAKNEFGFADAISYEWNLNSNGQIHQKGTFNSSDDNRIYFDNGNSGSSPNLFKPMTSKNEGNNNSNYYYHAYLFKKSGGVTYNNYITSCTCSSYSFNYGPLSGESNWETPLCFEFETGTTDTYYIKNFTIPTTVTSSTQFYVGWQGVFQGDNEHPSYSQTWNIVDNNPAYNKMRLTHSLVVDGESNRDFVPVLKIENANVCGLGAQGTLKVCGNHNNNYDNKYVGFIPAGYALNWGPTVGDWETPLAFTAASNNIEETVWTTDIVTLTSIRKAYNYYVGLKTASGNVYSGRSSTSAISGMPAKSGTDSWEGSGVSNVAANSRGKFRVWADNNQLNWNCHFVPYIGVTYYDADNSSVLEQTSDANAVSIEADANDKKFTITSSEPTKANYTFVGWNTSADQTTATYTSGQTNVALSAWTYLYPAFTENPKSNVTISVPGGNGTVTSSPSNPVYQGTTVTLTITPSSGYQLLSISAVDAGSNVVSVTKQSATSYTFTMPASAVTVTAAFVVKTDYVLVESALDDYSGEYLIVCNNSGTEGMYALSGRNGNKDAATYGTYTNVWDYYDSGTKTIESNATTDAMKMVIEPGETDGKYTIYFESDETYLGMLGTNASTGDKLRFFTSPIANTNVYEWSISIISESTNHRISIWNTAATPARFDLERNGSNGYRLYQYTQQDPELYKKVETCSKLAAPTGLTETSVTQTTCTLGWNAVANASGYEVSLDGGSNWTSTGTNRTYSVTEGAGWTQGTSHTWKVRATGDGSTYCDKGTVASHIVTMKAAVTVTYRSNGSTGGQLPVAGGVFNLTEGDSHTICGNTGSGGSPSPLTKTGYVFDGWHSSSTYSSTPAYTIGGSITVNSSIIIYANWKPKKDTFVDAVHNTATQYGEGVNYEIPSCDNQTRYTSGTCEQTHYKFIGWALPGADLTNPANIIHAGDTQTASGTDASPKTYYAVWAEEL